MSTKLSALEAASKYLSPDDKAEYLKIKRTMEAAGAPRSKIEERLHNFIWEIIESDDDDYEDDENIEE
ncbi:hypothetical protein ACI0FM_13980 [Paenochrobactrum sp. BZR 588]|uniref:hypothetical protein n=1 Tax=Paenochrobactrum TaxID=999488 RepID=UPI0035BC1494